MNHVARVRIACALLFVLAGSAGACSMFSVAQGDTVYFANNEDFPSTGQITFLPGKGARLGRVNLSLADGFVQGSMNERGLCFDCAALPKVAWTRDPTKKDTKNLIELIMDSCGTVDEALAKFDEYNCTHLADGQFMFADASGASAVVTWDPPGKFSVVRRERPYLLITNDRVAWSGLRDPRFVLADRVLSAAPVIDLNTCKTALGVMRQHGPAVFTSYSNIFEPKSRQIHLFNLGNFDEELALDLGAELAKGRRTMPLAGLFQHSPALETITAMPQTTYDTEIRVPSETLAAFVGTYKANDADVTVVVTLDPDKGLLLAAAGQRAVGLMPESEADFRFRETFGTVTFERDASGRVSGMTMHRPGNAHLTRMDK